MRIPATRKRRSALSMTSLIDVIFLLLLFFMLTSTFIRHQQVAIAAPNPQGARGENTPDAILQTGTDGSVRLNGETVEMDGLSARLATVVEAGASSLLISITPDGDSQTLVGAVEAANRAGFSQVAVSD